MGTDKSMARDIDEYIAGFPEEVREILEAVRATIRKAAPDAVETISYQIPTFNLHGSYLIYFAGYKKHVGIYPAPLEHPELKDELAPYASGKGTVQFRYDKPIPLELIARMVKLRAKENLEKAKAKKK